MSPQDQPQTEAHEPNLDVCPQCGGPADNGHDRCIPPSPYNCSKCQDQTEAPGRCRCGGEAKLCTETVEYHNRVLDSFLSMRGFVVRCLSCSASVVAPDPDTARDMWRRCNKISAVERVLALPGGCVWQKMSGEYAASAFKGVYPRGRGPTPEAACKAALDELAKAPTP